MNLLTYIFNIIFVSSSLGSFIYFLWWYIFSEKVFMRKEIGFFIFFSFFLSLLLATVFNLFSLFSNLQRSRNGINIFFYFCNLVGILFGLFGGMYFF